MSDLLYWSVVRRIAPDSFVLTGQKAPRSAGARVPSGAFDTIAPPIVQHGCIFGSDGQGRESRPVFAPCEGSWVADDGLFLVHPR